MIHVNVTTVNSMMYVNVTTVKSIFKKKCKCNECK